jgi:RTX calcium-binding nonapeptide repeat (4 copies)/Divergent InlB B-repeat domain
VPAVVERQPVRRRIPILAVGGVLVLAVAALIGGSVATAAQATVTLAVVVPTGAPTVEITWPGQATPFRCEEDRCAVAVPANLTVTLTALGTFSSSNPFNGWAGACTSTSRSCALAMNANREVLVRRKLTVSPQRGTDGSAGFGTIAFSPTGASCQPSCQLYDTETGVTLTATPSAGHVFYRWDDPDNPIQPDPCEGGEFVATCVLRTTKYDRAIAALFLPDPTLQVAVTGNAGAVTVSPGGECAAGNSDCKFTAARGTRVRLTPRAVSRGTFVGWSVPECPGTGDCTIELDAPLRTVVAHFVPTQLTVGVSNSGTVRSSESPPRISCSDSGGTCTADYTTLAEVTLVASPANAFRGWNGVCAFAGTAPTCTFRLSGHDDVGAWFNGPDGRPVIVPPRVDYEVEVRRTGNGDGTVRSNRSPRAQEQIECGTKCDATFFEDEVVVLEAQETAGSAFGGWKVTGASCAMDRRCTIPVRGSTRVEVAFSRSLPPGRRCSARKVGGPGGNRLDGGNGGDAIFGRAGNDRIWGFGGADCLNGEGGNDVLNGGPGADTLNGGPGADTLNGGVGRDLVLARDGQRDTIACGPGRDTVRADRLDRVAGCELVRRSG